jgi:hypothetical protein
MSRPSNIWLRKQTGWWMTTVNGVQHKLAKDESKARKAFYKLMAQGEPALTRQHERHSVRWLCDKFLDRTREAKTAETFTIQHGYLKAFCKEFGIRFAESLRVHEVNEWLDQTGWNSSTKALVVTIVKAVFNWSVAIALRPGQMATASKVSIRLKSGLMDAKRHRSRLAMGHLREGSLRIPTPTGIVSPEWKSNPKRNG